MKTLATFAAIVIGTVAATLAVHVIVYAILCSAPQENAMRVLDTVENICDYSHSVDSGEWEEACGMALDTANVSYICPSRDPQVDCYVRDNQ